MSTKIAFINARFFDGEILRENTALLVENDIISGFVEPDKIPDSHTITDLGGGLLAPGFIDMQVNGGGSVLFNNTPTVEGLKTISDAHLRFGTTSIMPTVISDTVNVVKNCVTAVEQAIEKNPSLLGIHIEGPFFTPSFRGVHHKDHIRLPDDADINYLTSLNKFPVILTIAPEQLNSTQIKALSTAGILLCAGHTNANYDTVLDAIENGLSGFTHLYNAMGKAQAREPNVMGAALMLDETTASIIADGHHVHPQMVQLAYRCKPKGKLIFVSDAMSTIGGSPKFKLYDEIIHEVDGRIVNEQGTLAGSAIALIDAVRISTTQMEIPIEESLAMASLFPAQYLGVADTLGRLKAGYTADIVHLTNDFYTQTVWKKGKKVI